MASGYFLAFEDAVRAALKADDGMKAIVGSTPRVYQPETADDPTYPYATAGGIPGRAKHLLGIHEPYAADARVQVEGLAKTRTECAQLLDAVFACLEGTLITVTGWGQPRLEDEGERINRETIKGVRVYRGIARFKGFLTRG